MRNLNVLNYQIRLNTVMSCITFSLYFTSVNGLNFLYYYSPMYYAAYCETCNCLSLYTNRWYSSSMRNIVIVTMTLASLFSPFVRRCA